MFLSILTFLLGILVSHLYYRASIKAAKQSEKELRRLLYKLPQNVVRAISRDDRAHLTVPELNQLLRAQTIDENSDDPLAYKACPKCGSKQIRQIEKGLVDGDRDGLDVMPVRVVQCSDCKWEYDELQAEGIGRPDLV